MNDLGPNEVEIKSDEFRHWANLPVTQEFVKRLCNLFDHQRALLGMADGVPADLLRGRAQVLDFVLNPHRLFEE